MLVQLNAPSPCHRADNYTHFAFMFLETMPLGGCGFNDSPLYFLQSIKFRLTLIDANLSFRRIKIAFGHLPRARWGGVRTWKHRAQRGINDRMT
jgi:hypothetical protein